MKNAIPTKNDLFEVKICFEKFAVLIKRKVKKKEIPSKLRTNIILKKSSKLKDVLKS
jgi:hypothetical protein